MLVQAIRRSRLLRIAIDLRVTVVCLALLFLLTLLGTFHQVSHGLYDAQQRYFGAWITLVGGFVPLPGAQLVLYLPPEGRSSPFVNARGIAELRPRRRSVRPEENQPGAILHVSAGSERASLALWALDPAPASVTLNGQRYAFSLRRARYELPALIGLDDFRAEFYPGTDTPRSFESDVILEAPGTRRPVLISMNKPLRFSGFTFYQASYEFDAAGAAYSTLAVVENRGRVVPYVATAVISIGLIVHFIQSLVRPGRRRRGAQREPA